MSKILFFSVMLIALLIGNSSGDPHNIEKRNPGCDCDYHRGGCSISSPAPAGFKCVCVYKGAWTCSGWAQSCAPHEGCNGGDYSYCGCRKGGGDCGAYRDKPRC